MHNSKFVSYLYSQSLASNNGMLLHAASVVKDKKAFLFLGVSGAGKSTIAALSKRHNVLGDDVIAVRKRYGDYYAFQTPWKQQPFIKIRKPGKGKIVAIFFIKKSNRVFFEALSPENALVNILSNHVHFLVCTPRPLAERLFSAACDFVKRVPAYKMEFKKETDFWKELEEKVR